MNERIQQFAEQAKASVPAGLLVTEWIERYNEIFAKLIVQECMTICKKHPSRDLDNGWFADAVAPHLVQQFEEHFGVEESKREKFRKSFKEAFKNGLDLSGQETP